MEPMHGRFEMDKFDGKGDFGMWKYKMQAQLEIQGLLTVIQDSYSMYADSVTKEEGEGEDPPKEPQVDQKKLDKDLRVRSLLGTFLSDPILRKIMHEPTAMGQWKALEKIYQTKSLPNRIYLKKQFSCYKMEENKSIEENVDTFLKLIADLGSLKITISDEDQAIQLLSGLPPAYDQLVHTLQYGTGKETLTVDEVITSAYSKEAELRQKGLLPKGKSAAEALYVENRGRSEKRTDNGKGKKSKNDKSKKGGKSKSKNDSSKGECFVCGKEGHWKRECPQREKKNGESSANVVEEVKQPFVLTASQKCSKDDWVLDSGCTFHITHNKNLLFDFEAVDGGDVLMANNTLSKVKGIGKIRFINPDDTVVILT